MVAFTCCMYNDFSFFFILFINNNYLFKLMHLLHERIDPTVEELRKKPQVVKIKRVQRYKSMTSIPSVGTPSWCLNTEALRRFNRSTDNIPNYDYNTDEDDGNHSDTENENDKRKNKKKIEKTKKKG